MELTPEEQLRVSMMFDSYIKTCCKHELINIVKRRIRMKKKDILLIKAISINFDTSMTGLIVPDFVVKGHEITINDQSLLDALEMLEPNERELILLLFYVGYKPEDASIDLEVGERTVYNRKNKILEKMKKHMEEDE